LKFAEKLSNCMVWLPAYLWQQWSRRRTFPGTVHLIFCLANHFEPSIVPTNGRARAPRGVQEKRLEQWCEEIPKAVQEWRDAEGFPLRHTYFYPGEQYDRGFIERLAYHCHAGWGEIEVHLHHGTESPDTPENTRQMLLSFRDTLASHGCLSQLRGQGEPRYAFVHGNFSLANSADNKNCGVDAEMKILSETGCFGDFTLPSAPNPSQIAKINALYECGFPLEERAPHRKGRDLTVGVAPQIFPLIVQGPLMWDFSRRKRGLPYPAIENSELASLHPPTMERLRLWRRAAIVVLGRPDWLFVKLHCHGMDPRDESTMFGEPMKIFLRKLVEGAARSREYQVHFTTAREMVNIICAACDGQVGNPGNYRDFRFLPIRGSMAAKSTPQVSSLASRSEH
jgi:hypothetical protein